jgi:hypothetical protein
MLYNAGASSHWELSPPISARVTQEKPAKSCLYDYVNRSADQWLTKQYNALIYKEINSQKD